MLPLTYQSLLQGVMVCPDISTHDNKMKKSGKMENFENWRSQLKLEECSHMTQRRKVKLVFMASHDQQTEKKRNSKNKKGHGEVIQLIFSQMRWIQATDTSNWPYTLTTAFRSRS